MYDVVISGAGPSGSKCAEIFAKAGFKTALLERNCNWRKPCGGAVSSRIFKYYPKLRKYNFHEITGVSMYSSQRYKLSYSWKDSRETSINVDRLKFDNIIRNSAIDSGAELYDRNIVTDFIYKQGNKIGIKAKSVNGEKEYRGRIIVIADGMSSKLAIRSGLRDKWKIEETYQAKCAIMKGELNLEKDKISIFFMPYKGYGWIFPLENNLFNIGCGTCNEDNYQYNLNSIFYDFLKETQTKRIMARRDYKTIWTGAYPMPGLGVNAQSLYDDNLMIVGDAAGFVSPISGEGIHSSIVSGQISAEIGINALENEDLSKKSLKSYKSHPNIKKIIRNFRLKRSMVDFFFKDEGKKLNAIFRLAAENDEYREKIIDMFLFNQPISREILLKLNS